MPAYGPKMAGALSGIFPVSSGNSRAMARFIHTSMGKHSSRPIPYSSTHSATLGPTPRMRVSSRRASASGMTATACKSTVPAATCRAASRM